MNEKLLEQIIGIINDVNDMTIATVRADGFPQATTVSYMNDGLSIYFITPANSQKAANIAANNKVSLTINREYQSWDDIEGLSIGGLATVVSDPAEREKISALLLKKFPQAAQYENDGSIELTFFRVEPKFVSLLDYKKGFGHTENIRL